MLDASLTTRWGPEEYTFALGLPQWRKVQADCDAGPGEIFRRLIAAATVLEKGLTLTQAAAMGMIGDWRVDDVRSPILWGLVGGGLTELQAGALVATRVDPKGADYKVNIALAYRIVKAGLGESEDEPLGEKVGRANPRRAPSRTAKSAGRKSGATA
jgi:hypothetical protein